MAVSGRATADLRGGASVDGALDVRNPATGEHIASVPATTAEYIAKNRITQVIFGRSAVKGWKQYLYYHALGQFMSNAPHVDVHIVTQMAK